MTPTTGFALAFVARHLTERLPPSLRIQVSCRTRGRHWSGLRFPEGGHPAEGSSDDQENNDRNDDDDLNTDAHRSDRTTPSSQPCHPSPLTSDEVERPPAEPVVALS